ncbi:phosphoenolpyruvate synthase [Inmirania thermothiophila]|uniref:Phosphoenolpyruvate synthase n=1 Tax=Inmirania thermothiophila TaxID=1750597 RepID=A0A3N1Y539_9GAMM|nr:phosphoenolpyruvate synthase [Inmirania thermothiophila]ROR32752.1 phosphoenolpyruvate synthase [Inmirania thermothiophila]
MRYVRRFAELGMQDVPLVGGKNASLGEMYRALSHRGVKVPNGFATTTEAYHHFLDHNGLRRRITEALAALDVEDVRALAETGARIRGWILEAEMPADLAEEIAAAYGELAVEYGPDPDVAVRSSATAEDLPNASFAGQQDTYLNIRGAEAVIATCQRVYASLFTDRAISYRVHQGFDHMQVGLSVGVQKMVRSDLAASGVMFTLDTETGFRDVVFITAAYGLGENVVQGQVNPDEFYVFKPTLASGHRPIIRRHLGEKAQRLVYAEGGEEPVRNEPVPQAERDRFCISDEEVLQLARYAVAIEAHYSEQAGRPMPMDIEWAKDGVSGELFIVQARPETVRSRDDGTFQETYKLKARGEVLATGKSVGQKIAVGRVRVIPDASRMHELEPGEILVTDITDPDWEPVMKVAAAIVTNRGGRTCHAAIIARELGIPAVVGTGNATEVLESGTEVTVSCAEGNTGYIYRGALPFEVERVDLSQMERPRTKVLVNLGNPEVAFEVSRLPADGVGLARLEFIINNTIKVHPRALLEYERVDAETRAVIDGLVRGYADRRDYFVRRLAEGVGTIAAAFYPRPVIVRMSDFKSNEYAAMIGGRQFEPEEENPMLGYRGASRYHSPQFAECFAMECEAMRLVRDEMGLTNVWLMLPFVRTVEEGVKVLELMAANGLERGRNDLRIIVMCELPANALLADEFLEHFDGFSIGSNDLTQLTLGVDRDSGILTGYDERNPAVLKLMEMAIEACNRHGKYIGICGQAPSDFPEITRWLVERGIQSLSLNPDSVLEMSRVVLEEERRLKERS